MNRRAARALFFTWVLAWAWACPAQEASPTRVAVAAEIEQMGHPVYKDREEAFRILSEWARTHALARDLLTEAARSHADLEVRERSRMILEETKYDFSEIRFALPGLAAQLRSDNLSEQLEGLDRLPRNAEALEILREILQAPDLHPGFRGAVVGLIGRIPGPATVAFLTACARNPQETCRDTAILLLGKLRIRDREVEDLMLAAAKDPRDPARETALRALLFLGTPRAGSVFCEILKDPQASPTMMSVAILGGALLADKRCAPALRRIAEAAGPSRDVSEMDPGHPYRRQYPLLAVRALGEIDDEQAVEGLIGVLSRGADDDLRREACLALGRIRAVEAVSPLWECLKNPGETLRVRKAAASALRQITGRRFEGPMESQVAGYARSLGQ